MGKDKNKRNKKKGKGAEKTLKKTEKKIANKQKRMMEKLGEADIAEIVKKLEVQERLITAVTANNCLPPTPRSNFSLVAHPEKDELILFGGEFCNGANVEVYNDVFFYNISRNEWKRVRSPSGPTPRSSHQMVAVAKDGGQLWVFGGEHASPSQLQFYHYKDLWVMGLKTLQWAKVNSPNGPSARSGHRMVASKKRLFVFGGFHDNNQSYHYYNDMHVFSIETYEWLKIDIGGALVPSVRSGCCMAAAQDGKIYVWGGYTKTSMKNDAQRGITHSDMFVFELDKHGDGNKYKWSTVKPRGYRPKPRNSVGYTVAPNGKAYCFGGVMDVNENDENVEGQFGDELLAFDLASQNWHMCEVVAKTKKESKKESTESSTDDEMEDTTKSNSNAAGGSGEPKTTYKSNIPSLFPKRRTDVPSPRMHAGLCVLKGTLYLFGGVFEEDDKQCTFNDFYSLDLHKLDQWKVIIQAEEKPHEWIDDSESSSNEDDSDSESNSGSSSSSGGSNSDEDSASAMDTN